MKIGIIRLSSLGDVVLATAVLKPLREAYPGSEIVFVVRSEYVEVFMNNSYLSRVVEWKKGSSFKALLTAVREERFDVLIDLHSNVRSHWITAVSGAGRIIRYKKSHVSRRLSLLRKSKPRKRHVVDRYLDVIGFLGVKNPAGAPAMYPGMDDMLWAETFLKKRGYSGGLLIGIAPGARRMTKMWPAEKYWSVAKSLISSKGASVVMVGDGGDVETAVEVLQKSPAVMDAVGATDLVKLAALLSRCDVVISNDSAPTHIAVAVGTPVVTIFGPTIEEFGFAPYGENNLTVSTELYCRPCSLHGTDTCPEGHFRCMKEIRWEEVYQGVEKLLNESEGAR
ncbi:MAG: glycosyltransferase family 9 protein [bacterium]